MNSADAKPTYDWINNKCYIGNANSGDACNPTDNTESVSIFSSINRTGF